MDFIIPRPLFHAFVALSVQRRFTDEGGALRVGALVQQHFDAKTDRFSLETVDPEELQRLEDMFQSDVVPKLYPAAGAAEANARMAEAEFLADCFDAIGSHPELVLHNHIFSPARSASQKRIGSKADGSGDSSSSAGEHVRVQSIHDMLHLARPLAPGQQQQEEEDRLAIGAPAAAAATADVDAVAESAVKVCLSIGHVLNAAGCDWEALGAHNLAALLPSGGSIDASATAQGFLPIGGAALFGMGQLLYATTQAVLSGGVTGGLSALSAAALGTSLAASILPTIAVPLVIGAGRNLYNSYFGSTTPVGGAVGAVDNPGGVGTMVYTMARHVDGADRYGQNTFGAPLSISDNTKTEAWERMEQQFGRDIDDSRVVDRLINGSMTDGFTDPLKFVSNYIGGSPKAPFVPLALPPNVNTSLATGGGGGGPPVPTQVVFDRDSQPVLLHNATRRDDWPPYPDPSGNVLDSGPAGTLLHNVTKSQQWPTQKEAVLAGLYKETVPQSPLPQTVALADESASKSGLDLFKAAPPPANTTATAQPQQIPQQQQQNDMPSVSDVWSNPLGTLGNGAMSWLGNNWRTAGLVLGGAAALFWLLRKNGLALGSFLSPKINGQIGMNNSTAQGGEATSSATGGEGGAVNSTISPVNRVTIRNTVTLNLTMNQYNNQTQTVNIVVPNGRRSRGDKLSHDFSKLSLSEKKSSSSGSGGSGGDANGKQAANNPVVQAIQSSLDAITFGITNKDLRSAVANMSESLRKAYSAKEVYQTSALVFAIQGAELVKQVQDAKGQIIPALGAPQAAAATSFSQQTETVGGGDDDGTKHKKPAPMPIHQRVFKMWDRLVSSAASASDQHRAVFGKLHEFFKNDSNLYALIMLCNAGYDEASEACSGVLAVLRAYELWLAQSRSLLDKADAINRAIEADKVDEGVGKLSAKLLTKTFLNGGDRERQQPSYADVYCGPEFKSLLSNHIIHSDDKEQTNEPLVRAANDAIAPMLRLCTGYFAGMSDMWTAASNAVIQQVLKATENAASKAANNFRLALDRISSANKREQASLFAVKNVHKLINQEGGQDVLTQIANRGAFSSKDQIMSMWADVRVVHAELGRCGMPRRLYSAVLRLVNEKSDMANPANFVRLMMLNKHVCGHYATIESAFAYMDPNMGDFGVGHGKLSATPQEARYGSAAKQVAAYKQMLQMVRLVCSMSEPVDDTLAFYSMLSSKVVVDPRSRVPLFTHADALFRCVLNWYRDSVCTESIIQLLRDGIAEVISGKNGIFMDPLFVGDIRTRLKEAVALRESRKRSVVSTLNLFASRYEQEIAKSGTNVLHIFQRSNAFLGLLEFAERAESIAQAQRFKDRSFARFRSIFALLKHEILDAFTDANHSAVHASLRTTTLRSVTELLVTPERAAGGGAFYARMRRAFLALTLLATLATVDMGHNDANRVMTLAVMHSTEVQFLLDREESSKQSYPTKVLQKWRDDAEAFARAFVQYAATPDDMLHISMRVFGLDANTGKMKQQYDIGGRVDASQFNFKNDLNREMLDATFAGLGGSPASAAPKAENSRPEVQGKPSGKEGGRKEASRDMSSASSTAKKSTGGRSTAGTLEQFTAQDALQLASLYTTVNFGDDIDEGGVSEKEDEQKNKNNKKKNEEDDEGEDLSDEEEEESNGDDSDDESVKSDDLADEDEDDAFVDGDGDDDDVEALKSVKIKTTTLPTELKGSYLGGQQVFIESRLLRSGAGNYVQAKIWEDDLLGKPFARSIALASYRVATSKSDPKKAEFAAAKVLAERLGVDKNISDLIFVWLTLSFVPFARLFNDSTAVVAGGIEFKPYKPIIEFFEQAQQQQQKRKNKDLQALKDAAKKLTAKHLQGSPALIDAVCKDPKKDADAWQLRKELATRIVELFKHWRYSGGSNDRATFATNPVTGDVLAAYNAGYEAWLGFMGSLDNRFKDQVFGDGTKSYNAGFQRTLERTLIASETLKTTMNAQYADQNWNGAMQLMTWTMPMPDMPTEIKDKAGKVLFTCPAAVLPCPIVMLDDRRARLHKQLDVAFVKHLAEELFRVGYPAKPAVCMFLANQPGGRDGSDVGEADPFDAKLFGVDVVKMYSGYVDVLQLLQAEAIRYAMGDEIQRLIDNKQEVKVVHEGRMLKTKTQRELAARAWLRSRTLRSDYFAQSDPALHKIIVSDYAKYDAVYSAYAPRIWAQLRTDGASRRRMEASVVRQYCIILETYDALELNVLQGIVQLVDRVQNILANQQSRDRSQRVYWVQPGRLTEDNAEFASELLSSDDLQRYHKEIGEKKKKLTVTSEDVERNSSVLAKFWVDMRPSSRFGIGSSVSDAVRRKYENGEYMTDRKHITEYASFVRMLADYLLARPCEVYRVCKLESGDGVRVVEKLAKRMDGRSALLNEKVSKAAPVYPLDSSEASTKTRWLLDSSVASSVAVGANDRVEHLLPCELPGYFTAAGKNAMSEVMTTNAVSVLHVLAAHARKLHQNGTVGSAAERSSAIKDMRNQVELLKKQLNIVVRESSYIPIARFSERYSAARLDESLVRADDSKFTKSCVNTLAASFITYEEMRKILLTCSVALYPHLLHSALLEYTAPRARKEREEEEAQEAEKGKQKEPSAQDRERQQHGEKEKKSADKADAAEPEPAGGAESTTEENKKHEKKKKKKKNIGFNVQRQFAKTKDGLTALGALVTSSASHGVADQMFAAATGFADQIITSGDREVYTLYEDSLDLTEPSPPRAARLIGLRTLQKNKMKLDGVEPGMQAAAEAAQALSDTDATLQKTLQDANGEMDEVYAFLLGDIS
jgi:hypothetical protein